ncbi:MAG: ShlB/FhaC/HecB family hemolysin secretion/activation protein [Acetobacteraceae bacterium]
MRSGCRSGFGGRWLLRVRLAALLCGAAIFPALAQLPPRGSPLPGIVPPTEPRLAPGLKPAAPLPPTEPETAGPRYAIERIVIDGVTAFPDATIAGLLRDAIGPAVPEGEIEAARRSVIDLYRAHGYLYTTASVILTGTELRLTVIEGYIAEVKLEGDIGPAATQVLRFLNNLVGQKPVSTAELERWLLLAQDIPGLTVRSTLNPSAGDPGVLTLIAQVSRKPVSGFISADNRAYNLTGPQEGLIVFNLDSFTEFGERTQLSLYRAAGRTNRFAQISSEVFIGGSGLKLHLYAGQGVSTPSGSLSTIGYRGETSVLGGSLAYPVLRARDQSLVITGALDALESDIANSLGPNGSRQRGSFDSLRVLRLGVDYARLDTWFGDDRSGISSISLRASQGLDMLGASSNNDTTTPPPRPGETITFRKINGELARTQTLFQLFSDSSLALRTAVAWQWSGDLLPPVEKFYLGGPRFNRGYYYGQVTGDKAVTISTELQFNAPVPVPAFVPVELRSQLYAFYDWGRAFQNTALEANVSLQSMGGGIRLFVSDIAEIDLEAAYRMNQYPNGQGPNVSPLKSGALYWQVLFRF